MHLFQPAVGLRQEENLYPPWLLDRKLQHLSSILEFNISISLPKGVVIIFIVPICNDKVIHHSARHGSAC